METPGLAEAAAEIATEYKGPGGKLLQNIVKGNNPVSKAFQDACNTLKFKCNNFVNGLNDLKNKPGVTRHDFQTYLADSNIPADIKVPSNVTKSPEHTERFAKKVIEKVTDIADSQAFLLLVAATVYGTLTVIQIQETLAVLKEADAVLAAYAPRLQAVLDGLAPVLRWIDEIVDGNPERRLIDRAINMIAAASNDLRGIRQDIHEAKQDLDSSKTNHLWLLGGGLILGGGIGYVAYFSYASMSSLGAAALWGAGGITLASLAANGIFWYKCFQKSLALNQAMHTVQRQINDLAVARQRLAALNGQVVNNDPF